jgi:hypothetical protein
MKTRPVNSLQFAERAGCSQPHGLEPERRESTRHRPVIGKFAEREGSCPHLTASKILGGKLGAVLPVQPQREYMKPGYRGKCGFSSLFDVKAG